MQEPFLCVMAGFDPASEKKLTSLQNELFSRGFVGTGTRHLPHHITLGIFPAGPLGEQELSERLRRAAAGTEPLPLEMQHLGLFSGSRVMFAAPNITRELLTLKEQFSKDPIWTPHATLLIDEPSTVLSAVQVLAERFKPLQVTVTTLYLYEFFPGRRILALPLAGSNT